MYPVCVCTQQVGLDRSSLVHCQPLNPYCTCIYIFIKEKVFHVSVNRDSSSPSQLSFLPLCMDDVSLSFMCVGGWVDGGGCVCVCVQMCRGLRCELAEVK